MNAINFMSSEIKETIPYEIMEIAFSDKRYSNLVNIDSIIVNDVIRGRLMAYLNLASQEVVYVKKDSCDLIMSNDSEAVYRIPKELTGGRLVISAHIMIESGYPSMGTYPSRDGTMTSLAMDASKAANNLSNLTIVNTARVDLIGDNTLYIDGSLLDFGNFLFKVVIENDYNLNNMSPKVYTHLSHMAKLVTMNKIYNSLVVKMAKGYIFNGHELSIVNDIINEFKDAEELFQTYYQDIWLKVSFMQNSHNMDAFIDALGGNAN